MSKKLWEASLSVKKKSNLFQFETFLSKENKYKSFTNYNKLLNWSIKNRNLFWSSIWDFTEVKGNKSNKFKNSKEFFKNEFFINSKLNFTENLLRKNNHDKAITFISENGFREVRSWHELKNKVKNLSNFFLKKNISKGDRIAAYMPNQIETVECFLSTCAIGAIWSSCSPDFGTEGLIERFSQINPKMIIITDRYYYNGKEINLIERLPKILKKIKSIKTVLIFSYPGKKLIKYNKKKNIKFFTYKDILSDKENNFKFKMIQVYDETISIDTPFDLENANKYFLNGENPFKFYRNDSPYELDSVIFFQIYDALKMRTKDSYTKRFNINFQFSKGRFKPNDFQKYYSIN